LFSICIIKVRFQFLFFQAFNEAGVSLVPDLAVPRPTFPKLSINNPELVNFIYTTDKIQYQIQCKTNYKIHNFNSSVSKNKSK
jgi:hypothetical protein